MHARVTAVATCDPRQSELIERVLRCASGEGLHATSLKSLSLIRFDSCSPQLPSVYDPCLCFVVQGRKRALLGDETYVYDPLNYLVVSMTLPVIGQIIEASPQRPYLCMRISIDVPMLADLLLQAGPTLAATCAADRALYIARTGRCCSMRSCDSCVWSISLATPRCLRRWCCARFTIVCFTASSDKGCASCVASTARPSASRARSSCSEPLRRGLQHRGSRESGAHECVVTPSSVQGSHAMSPMQYQKHLRLHEARRLMLAEGMEASSAAHSCGLRKPVAVQPRVPSSFRCAAEARDRRNA